MRLSSGKIEKDERLPEFLSYDYSTIAGLTSEGRDAAKMSIITTISVSLFHVLFVGATWISSKLISIRGFFLLLAIITTVCLIVLTVYTKKLALRKDDFSRFRAETMMYITVIVGLESLVIPITIFFNPSVTGIKLSFLMVVLRWIILTPAYIAIINSEIVKGNYQNGLQEKKDRKICQYRFLAASVCILRSVLGAAIIYICLLIVMITYMRPIYLQYLRWKYAKEYDMEAILKN